ncbi:MAG: hypothetical protein VBE63_02590 [Lamprobacter sp.]|uniref:hypothetical protein n=1 Tax=Lamprobacter sp. TaxID=3100796 RepID=UPI002B25BAE2|nr:hypothetical protein [Lamprobacter sp.]MEA3638813.1 hypothetical protein [Lamprobacter sp.]
MTSNQARGVRNMGAGATILGIGQNPASAAEVDRFVLLGLSGRTQENLPWVLRGDWSALAKDLPESRFAYFERLLAGYVIFYTAARTRDVVTDWCRLLICSGCRSFGRYGYSPRGASDRALAAGTSPALRDCPGRAVYQSGTRIATTAAPVPAISLDPQAYQPPTLRHGAISPARLQLDPHSVVPLPLASAGLDAQTLSACSHRYF